MSPTPRKMGRPTMDPKPVRLTFRLGRRDVDALQAVANELGGNLSEALRHLLRVYVAPSGRPARKGGRR